MDPTGIEMGGVAPGLIAIGIGLIVTFAGYGAFRFVLALVGALFGFSLGVGIVAGLGGDGVMGAIGMMAAWCLRCCSAGWRSRSTRRRCWWAWDGSGSSSGCSS